LDKQNADHEDRGIDELDDVAQLDGPLTGLKIDELLEELLLDERLFHLNDEGIARYLVQRLFNVNARKLSLGRLRELIAKVDGLPDNIPPEPEKVPKWVRKEVFWFEYLPRDKLAELHSWASEDLLAIEANIAHCESAIKEVRERSPKTDEDPSDIRFYKHYLELYEDAKNEIVEVLKHDMCSKALCASYGSSSMFSAWALQIPWSFRRYPKRFEPSSFSQVRHAFGRLPLREFPEVQRLYEAQDRMQFDQRLEGFIADTKPVENIRRLLEEHHLLADRKRVLLPALKAYEREEFELFISATAAQIEGIFADCCLLSKIPVDELRCGSIIKKLDKLKKVPIYIDYAYYACKFPILRNRIAHGRMLTGDPRRDAHLLLLDLYDCCRIVRSHPGTPNALVELLRRVKHDMATFADVVEFAAIYAETKGKERPNDFYGLTQEFESLTLLLDRQNVWAFLQELLGLQREELDNGLHLIGIQLQKTVPTRCDSCVGLLRGLGRHRGYGKFDRDDFMTTVRRQQGHGRLVKNVEEVRALFISVLRSRERWLRTSDAAHARWEKRGYAHGQD
jgi:hypothetical protein